MNFEAVKISRTHYQLFISDYPKTWVASFNSLNGLIRYYVNCHNLSQDHVKFTGSQMDKDEYDLLLTEADEWKMTVLS